MATKRTHNDIPWLKIKATMDSMIAKSGSVDVPKLATKFGYVGSDKADPYKPTRAIMSRGRNIGFRDEDGKTVFLPTTGMRNIGAGASKTPKVAKVKVTKVAKGKPGRKPSYGKTVLIQLTDDNKHVRFEADKPKALVPVQKLMPSITDLVFKMGFKLVALTPAAAPAKEPTAAATPDTKAPEAPAQPTPEVVTSATPTTEVAA